MSELKARLDNMAAVPGVRMAMAVGRDGFIVDASGQVTPDLEVPAAHVASAFVGCEAVGSSSDYGALERTIFEFAQGAVIAQRLGEGAALVLFLSPDAVVGRIRHQAKEMAAALAGAL